MGGLLTEAWLLLGPTGAGKTPLGEALAARSDGRVLHFDFGAGLRAVDAERLAVPGLSAEGRAIVRDVLARGALLADSQWFVAEAILSAFLARPCDRVVLNGLPRHVAQAVAMEPRVDVRRVLVLECDAATVRERLARDTGGDRAGRIDDGSAAVERRLALYRARTQPLIAHYRARGVPVAALPVGADTTAADLMRLLPVE